MKKIAIFGAGGCGRETLQYLNDINKMSPEWNLQGFLVEEQYWDAEKVHGYSKYTYLDWLKKNPDVYVVLAIGSSDARQRIAKAIEAQNDIKFATIVHPTAWVAATAKLGDGTVIAPGCLISADVVIGCHGYINGSAVIGHDVVLGDCVTVGPSANVGGSVLINAGVELGIGSLILPNLELGSCSILGAGSVATKNIESYSVYVGSPARLVKRKNNNIARLEV